MADQLNMSGLNLGPQENPSQPRSYIPPHMRVRLASQGGHGPSAPVGSDSLGRSGSPMNGGGPPPPAGVNGLSSSAWAG